MSKTGQAGKKRGEAEMNSTSGSDQAKRLKEASALQPVEIQNTPHTESAIPEEQRLPKKHRMPPLANVTILDIAGSPELANYHPWGPNDEFKYVVNEEDFQAVLDIARKKLESTVLVLIGDTKGKETFLELGVSVVFNHETCPYPKKTPVTFEYSGDILHSSALRMFGQYKKPVKEGDISKLSSMAKLCTICTITDQYSADLAGSFDDESGDPTVKMKYEQEIMRLKIGRRTELLTDVLLRLYVEHILKKVFRSRVFQTDDKLASLTDKMYKYQAEFGWTFKKDINGFVDKDGNNVTFEHPDVFDLLFTDWLKTRATEHGKISANVAMEPMEEHDVRQSDRKDSDKDKRVWQFRDWRASAFPRKSDPAEVRDVYFLIRPMMNSFHSATKKPMPLMDSKRFEFPFDVNDDEELAIFYETRMAELRDAGVRHTLMKYFKNGNPVNIDTPLDVSNTSKSEKKKKTPPSIFKPWSDVATRGSSVKTNLSTVVNVTKTGYVKVKFFMSFLNILHRVDRRGQSINVSVDPNYVNNEGAWDDSEDDPISNGSGAIGFSTSGVGDGTGTENGTSVGMLD
ncbi:MAG: hypothetical protein JSS82_12420 [Bacteroidetes bacterium]|nr:hypothetical protein [Bacteroidota bacterium]